VKAIKRDNGTGGYISVSLAPRIFGLVEKYAKIDGVSKAAFVARLVDEHDAAERATAELLDEHDAAERATAELLALPELELEATNRDGVDVERVAAIEGGA
jgi:hypothetical protein